MGKRKCNKENKIALTGIFLCVRANKEIKYQLVDLIVFLM